MRRFPQWAERLLQVAISVGVTLAGLVGWGYARGANAGLETARVVNIEERLTRHEADDEHHFSREDAERLVRVEEGVKALLRRGGK
jgi:hypothetical protein